MIQTLGSVKAFVSSERTILIMLFTNSVRGGCQ